MLAVSNNRFYNEANGAKMIGSVVTCSINSRGHANVAAAAAGLIITPERIENATFSQSYRMLCAQMLEVFPPAEEISTLQVLQLALLSSFRVKCNHTLERLYRLGAMFTICCTEFDVDVFFFFFSFLVVGKPTWCITATNCLGCGASMQELDVATLVAYLA